jgi:nucleoid-associated protein YgaU
MLNKDEYNQEEYNDYYRQEVEGAEIGNSEEEESGFMSKLIMLLVLLALAIAGYFGYKAMNNSAVDDIDTSLQVSAESSLPQSMQEEPEPITVIETKKEVEVEVVESKKELEPINVVQNEPIKTEPTPSVESSVTSEVTKAIATQGKMSSAEVAAVVTAVMQQMNQQKSSETSSAPLAVKEDVALMNELSNSEVDSVSSDLVKGLESVEISEHTKVNNSKKKIDVYNKVNVQDVTGADTLSQLSNQINAVMKEKVTQDKAENYTNSLKSEVDVRKNEMRIIVVRKGDTLGKIAKRAYGNVMNYEKIYKANPELTRPDRIYIGQKIRIPN